MRIFFKALYKYWMKFAHLLGTINGFIILLLFYLFIIGLYALPYKIFYTAARRKKKVRSSFWVVKEDVGEGLEHLTYQF